MPRRLKVSDRRNSECGSARLDHLDFSRWFTGGGDSMYLHVWHYDGETIHRVFCRATDTPRLGFDGIGLHWLVDVRGGDTKA